MRFSLVPAYFSPPDPLFRRLIAAIALGIPLLFTNFVFAGAAHAAQQMVVTYGALQVAFEISDLEKLVKTGEVPHSLKFYLDLANLTPNDLRSALAMEIPVSQPMLDRMLNTEGGEYMLSELTRVVHTPSQGADIPALRSAFVMAASDDQKISLLELLQKYPTQQVYINGGNLIQLASDLSTPNASDTETDPADNTPTNTPGNTPGNTPEQPN